MVAMKHGCVHSIYSNIVVGAVIFPQLVLFMFFFLRPVNISFASLFVYFCAYIQRSTISHIVAKAFIDKFQ